MSSMMYGLAKIASGIPSGTRIKWNVNPRKWVPKGEERRSVVDSITDMGWGHINAQSGADNFSSNARDWGIEHLMPKRMGKKLSRGSVGKVGPIVGSRMVIPSDDPLLRDKTYSLKNYVSQAAQQHRVYKWDRDRASAFKARREDLVKQLKGYSRKTRKPATLKDRVIRSASKIKPKHVVIGTGIAAAGTGAGLYLRHRSKKKQQKQNANTKTAALTPMRAALIGGAGAGALTTISQLGKTYSGEKGQKRINPVRIARNTLVGAALGAGASHGMKNLEATTKNFEATTKSIEGITEKARKNRAFGLFSRG